MFRRRETALGYEPHEKCRLANGDTIEDLLRDYPSLSHADIMACLQYAAELTEEQVTPIESLG